MGILLGFDAPSSMVVALALQQIGGQKAGEGTRTHDIHLGKVTFYH
jgi:hypothetical protein